MEEDINTPKVIGNSGRQLGRNKDMKNLTLKTLRIISILGALTSCEYHHEAILQNQTGQEIDLIIHFNKKTFEDAWGGRPYIPFIQQYGVGSGVTLETFDSINLVSHYKIQDNRVFVIDQGVGGKKQRPTYNKFSVFKIRYRRDSTIISDQEDFKKYFISNDYSDYIWTLK